MASKLTELWNTSLLFDLIYKFINGASLLALAKSINYKRDKRNNTSSSPEKRLAVSSIRLNILSYFVITLTLEMYRNSEGEPKNTQKNKLNVEG